MDTNKMKQQYGEHRQSIKKPLAVLSVPGGKQLESNDREVR